MTNESNGLLRSSLGRREFMRTLVRLIAAIAFVSAAVALPLATPAVAETGAPVVDGFLDPLYNSAFADVTYTQTGAGGDSGVVNGRIAVIETADAYYVGFQQGL